jgi:TonB family protein
MSWEAAMFRRVVSVGIAFALCMASLMSSLTAFAQAEEAAPAPAPLAAPAGPPSDDDTLTVLGLRPLETLRFVSPAISGVDAANAKEAWIHLKVTISATGDVTDARVVQAFPKNSYEKAVLKVVPGWKFQPLMRGGQAVDGATFDVGVAIYSELYESERNDSARGGTKRTVSRYNFTTLNNLIKELTGTLDLDAAGPRLEKLRLRYEDGDMTITDIARYYAAMARYERLRGNYNTSLAAAHGALLLSRFLDNRKMIYGLHLEVMSSLMSMGRNDDAVDYYDRWKSVTKIQMSKEGQETMEKLRAEGAGKGHPYTIVDFDAAHRYERKRTIGRSTRTCFGVDLSDGSQASCGDIQEAAMQTSLELISFDFPDQLDPGPLAKPLIKPVSNE